MINNAATKSVLICDTQPVAIEGMRGLLENSGDLRFAGGVCNISAAFELARTLQPAAIVIDKALGTGAIMDWLQHFQSAGCPTATVFWGSAINEAEALRLLQAGARGILRRTSEPDAMLTCLRAVTDGRVWMEDGIFGDTQGSVHQKHSALTPREHEVAELVEKGLRNRDIAKDLGIQTGTVKIHLKHIFEKTGVRGRHSLALTGLREKGVIAFASM